MNHLVLNTVPGSRDGCLVSTCNISHKLYTHDLYFVVVMWQ